jgi:uncharacterized UPF0160 family protein
MTQYHPATCLATPGIYATPEPVVIATHPGCHHADDVFGVAVLQLVFPNNQVIRTRDSQLIEDAHFAVDVGGVWDAQFGQFDHHQKGFAGARANGVVYASAGLVWSAYGAHCVSPWARYLNPKSLLEIVQSIDEELVQHLDRADTGAAMGAPGLFGWAALLSQFNSTWLEESCLPALAREELKFRNFAVAVERAKELILRIMADKVSEAAAANLVRNSIRVADGRVLVLGGAGMPWINVVCKEMPDVLFVLYPDSTDNQYQVRTVPVAPDSFEARADLPAAWAGLRDADLAEVSGVVDAAFCHNARFIGGAYSLAGAQKMAELALAAL